MKKITDHILKLSNRPTFEEAIEALEEIMTAGVTDDDIGAARAEYADEGICDALSVAEKDEIESAINLLEKMNDAEIIVIDTAGYSGTPVVWFPANLTEQKFAYYWSEENYSWDDLIYEITYDLEDAHMILTRDQEEYIRAADCVLDGMHARQHVASQLKDADDNIRQAACDAVEFQQITDLEISVINNIYGV